MAIPVFGDLMAQVRNFYESHDDLREFIAWPDTVEPQDVTPHHINAADLFQAETFSTPAQYRPLCDALVAAAPKAQWRETYKDTNIGQDFMDRFGCYCIIGHGGGFTSTEIAAWVVYMPAGLHYTWHLHPAEELYCVIAGEADFHTEAAPSVTLKAGQSSFHASNQPHAMTTKDSPVVALVFWRNGFDIPPVLTLTKLTSHNG